MPFVSSQYFIALVVGGRVVVVVDGASVAAGVDSADALVPVVDGGVLVVGAADSPEVGVCAAGVVVVVVVFSTQATIPRVT